MSLYLSRIRLKQAPNVEALARVLVPEEAGARIGVGHRLMWSLFADGPGRDRDFLWREDGGDAWRRATFMTLSARQPTHLHDLLEIETKPFMPALAPGQRLGFRLRACAAMSKRDPNAKRGKRVDPVAAALSHLEGEVRAEQRDAVIQEEGARWLAKQGARGGFRLAESQSDARPLLRVEGDRWHVVPRGIQKAVRYSSLDFEGTLIVEEPNTFLTCLAQGLGRAKAFGCGLMLIRKA